MLVPCHVRLHHSASSFGLFHLITSTRVCRLTTTLRYAIHLLLAFDILLTISVAVAPAPNLSTILVAFPSHLLIMSIFDIKNACIACLIQPTTFATHHVKLFYSLQYYWAWWISFYHHICTRKLLTLLPLVKAHRWPTIAIKFSFSDLT